jgi:hypothetical protein
MHAAYRIKNQPKGFDVQTGAATALFAANPARSTAELVAAN